LEVWGVLGRVLWLNWCGCIAVYYILVQKKKKRRQHFGIFYVYIHYVNISKNAQFFNYFVFILADFFFTCIDFYDFILISNFAFDFILKF
jgi:hypothetical protein